MNLLELIQLTKIIIFVEIGKIQNYIVRSIKQLTEESTKEALIDKLSNKLLRLELKKKFYKDKVFKICS